MPQLKIADVKEQVEKLEADLNQKFVGLVAELKMLLENANINPEQQQNIADGVAKIAKDVETLRSDMAGHVDLYNRHIVQQHSPKRK